MVKKIGQSFLALLMTLAMLAGLLPALTITATASEGVNHAPLAGFGKAMSFGDTFVTVEPAEDSSQDITGAFTVEMWIKRTGTDAGAAYVFARNGVITGQWAVLSDTEGFRFYTSTIATGVINESLLSVSDTNWHHIAYTYNGSVLTSYLDGVESGSTAVTVTLLNVNDFCIGNSKGGNNPAQDTLDELRLWNICRTGEEIRADMYRSISKTDADYSNLVFYCKFEEGGGQSITESVKNVSGTVYSKSSPTVSSNGVWDDSVPNPVWAAEGAAVYGYLIGSDVDGDALTYSIVSPASHGVAAITPNTNQFTYRPDNGFNGSDSFTYKVSDGKAESAAQTVNVTVTPTTPFYEGNAINYGNDTNDTLSSAYLTNKTSNITMEAWVKADTPSSDAKAVRIMYNGDSGSTGYGIYLESNKPCILMGGKSFIGPSPAVSLTTSQWYHLAAVLDGTTWTLYVNGVAYTNLIYSDTNFVEAAPNAPVVGNTFTVGNRTDLSENFTGSIDEVRFWTVARTEQQIKDNMYIKLQGNEPGLLAYYNFDQEGITPGGDNNGVTTVTDVAGNDNNLTISGFTLSGNTSNFVPSVTLGTFALGRSAYYAKEGDGSFAIPIVRTGGSEGSVTINYQTADGTALAGTDYTSTSGSVTFAAGETTKEVSVPILNSSIGTQKTFTFTIAGQSGVSIAAPSATVTITSKRSIVLGAAAIVGPSVGTTTAYNYIYFGNNTKPIKWRVLDAANGNAVGGADSLSDGTNTVLNSGAMFLLMDNLYDNLKSAYILSLPRHPIRMAPYNFNSLDLQTALRPAMTAMTADATYFTSIEQASMLQTSMTDSEHRVPASGEQTAISSYLESKVLAGDKLFPLSLKEADSVSYFPNGNADRIFECDSTAGVWWLRSCSKNSVHAIKVAASGIFQLSAGNESGGDCAVNNYMLPAFNLNKSKILFTSAADNSGQNASFAAPVPYSGTEWKLTLKDGNNFSTGASITSSGTVLMAGYPDETLTFNHAALSTLSANYTNVTAVLTDADGSILYYGSVNANTSETSSSVTIPAGLAAGSYTLSLYGEDRNGAKQTDYATGTPFKVTITVSPAPTVTAVTVLPATTTVVKGGTQQFFASVVGEHSPMQTVMWSVEGGITGTTIDTSGKLTLAAGETATTLTVKATSVLNVKKSGTATVTVKTPKPQITTPASYDVVNDGTTQELKLNVSGVNGHSGVTWTMTETDTSSILTLPTTTTGTLSNSDALSLGSIIVAPNPDGQPAKSGKVTISFSGGDDYESLPSDITVTFNLAQGDPVAAPTGLVLNFGNEKISGVNNTMEYVVDSSATAENWSSSTLIGSSEPISVTSFIGETAKYIHIRVKALTGGVPGIAADISLPARPSATEFAIDFATEKTANAVPTTVEYNTISASHDTWTSGADAPLALSPGTTAKTYYFRTKAAASNFVGTVQELSVPARPITPTGSNVSAVSAKGTAGLTTKLTFRIIGSAAISFPSSPPTPSFLYSSSDCEYIIVANGNSPAANATWTGLSSGTTIDNIAGCAATDDVYIRIKADADAKRFVSEPYKVLENLNISKMTYSGTQASSPTVSSKTDANVVLNTITVPGETVVYAKTTENTAPATGWQEGTTFESLNAGTAYYFFARVSENASHQAGSASDALSVTTKTSPGDAPGTLTAIARADSIAISADSACEYILTASDTPPEDWSNSEKLANGQHTFSKQTGSDTALLGATKYYIYHRTKETDGAMPSKVQKTQVNTALASPTAADFTVTQPKTTSGDTSKGVIVAKDTTADKYEYRTKTGVSTWSEWTTLPTSSNAFDAPATIELRVKAKDPFPASGAYTVNIKKYEPPIISHPTTTNTPIFVDGVEYDIGTTNTSGGVTTVTVDQTAIQKQLDGASVSVIIPIEHDSNADTVVAEFVVANVDEMAEKEMTLSVQVDSVSYNMPAVAVDTASLLKELGATDPEKVPVNVTIAQLTEDDINLEDGELVLPPVEFTVTASYGGKSTEIEVFEKYVQRVIEVPSGVNAGKITTAVVVENGKQRHVPTEVFQKDGKWYAKINSLTNSTYAFIYNEHSFLDAEGKWFESVVTEMASRGIINGRSEDSFDGNGNITRAEFAAILVRALGLPESGESDFIDVKAGDWYYGAVGKAYEYGLISGRGEGAFDPTASITRQEAMQMIYNASKVTEYTGKTGVLTGFADADSVADWAQKAAQFNVGSELILGSNGKLNPTANITRAESATVILRLLQNSGLIDVRTNVLYLAPSILCSSCIPSPSHIAYVCTKCMSIRRQKRC